MEAFGQTALAGSTDACDGRAAARGKFFCEQLGVEALEQEIIPAIFSTKKPGEQIRVWVIGCGSGETAYSFAMLLCEANTKLDALLQIQVFATDTDPRELSVARAGQYSEQIEQDVSAARLKRWFVARDNAYCVSKELRRTCTFASHNLIKDIPFSRIDLIFCADVLRRLSAGVQDDVIPLLHYVLKSGGYLLPVSDESLARHQHLFRSARNASRAYCRVESGEGCLPNFPISAGSERCIEVSPSAATPSSAATVLEDHAHRLETELCSMKELLRATTEQLKVANRDLKSASEEYQLVNEDLQHAETQQRVLFVTLQERVHHILAAVRSIVNYMGQICVLPDDVFAHFDGRINAFARAQRAFARHPQQGIDLEELIAEEVSSQAAGCEGQFTLAGPPVQIGEAVGQSLGLAFHELTTNALKFGALSTPSGRVDVTWWIDGRHGDRTLHLEWNEGSVPVVDPVPKRVGFGREFLERGLAVELGAVTSLEFRPGGARFIIDMALVGQQTVVATQ